MGFSDTDDKLHEAIKTESLGLEMYRKVFQGAKIYIPFNILNLFKH